MNQIARNRGASGMNQIARRKPEKSINSDEKLEII
jgi:hypothetical protein